MSEAKKQEIVFLDPPSATGKQMDAHILQKYWDKIRCYKLWSPYTIAAMGEVLVVTEPGAEGLKMSTDEYKEWRAANIDKLKEFRFLFKKPASLTNSYIWEADTTKLPDLELDETDRAFLKDPKAVEGLKEYKLFGYHTYGGYRGFFRPDLNEVIHLVASVVPMDQLVNVKRVYVTTDAYPSDKGSECYDSKKDMHKALTTCWVLK